MKNFVTDPLLHDAYMALPEEPSPAMCFELHVTAEYLEQIKKEMHTAHGSFGTSFAGVPVVLDPLVGEPGFQFVPQIRQHLPARM